MSAARAMIGRFTVEREAGSGGMGTIFRARDAETGALVALKLIRELRREEQIRFQREGRALAAVRHPGIVRYVDHGVTADGEAYLAMEWLDGEDLRARLTHVGLTVGETVTLGRRVAEALVTLHAEGLVHRDLKPGNLFLVGGEVSDVRIIDFGLVRGNDVTADLTRSGIAVGTPAYMSPEQARGLRDVDPRSDLFSLGCVMFKCLTGRAPFVEHRQAFENVVDLVEPHGEIDVSSTGEGSGARKLCQPGVREHNSRQRKLCRFGTADQTHHKHCWQQRSQEQQAI